MHCTDLSPDQQVAYGLLLNCIAKKGHSPSLRLQLPHFLKRLDDELLANYSSEHAQVLLIEWKKEARRLAKHRAKITEDHVTKRYIQPLIDQDNALLVEIKKEFENTLLKDFKKTGSLEGL